MELPVLGIAEARRGLPGLVDAMTTHPGKIAVIGAHRKPQAVLLPYDTFVELRNASLSNPSRVDLKKVKSVADLIKRLGATWGLHSIAVFGSVARGEERIDSDVDLLVDATPGTSYFDLAGFEADVEQILGRPVDVLTRDALDPQRKRDRAMLDDAVAL